VKKINFDKKHVQSQFQTDFKYVFDIVITFKILARKNRFFIRYFKWKFLVQVMYFFGIMIK